jgi:putative hydrolase of the HAD superfamily
VGRPSPADSWAGALRDQGWSRVAEAEDLAGRFRIDRSRRHGVYPEVGRELRSLRERGLRLGLLTNGDPHLQRAKIDASGLAPLFDSIVVSGERVQAGQVQRGKPDPRIFALVMEEMGVDRAVMVGDKVSRDIEGARAAGIGAVLIRRPGVDWGRFSGAGDTPQIASLEELPSKLPRLLAMGRSSIGEGPGIASGSIREPDREI